MISRQSYALGSTPNARRRPGQLLPTRPTPARRSAHACMLLAALLGAASSCAADDDSADDRDLGILDAFPVPGCAGFCAVARPDELEVMLRRSGCCAFQACDAQCYGTSSCSEEPESWSSSCRQCVAQHAFGRICAVDGSALDCNLEGSGCHELAGCLSACGGI